MIFSRHRREVLNTGNIVLSALKRYLRWPILERMKERRQLAFVRERAKHLAVDIPGRLEALDDMWAMIQTAKKSRDEALSKPQTGS